MGIKGVLQVSERMRIVRIWEILKKLEGESKWFGLSELASSFGATIKQLERDIGVLVQAGFPIEQEGRGKDKKVKLEMQSGTLSIPLTTNNLIALYLSMNLLSFLEGTPYFRAMKELVEKVSVVLPKDTLKKLEEIRKSFFAIRDPWKSYSEKAGIIATINEAVISRRKLSIRYKGPGWRAGRDYVIHPYVVFLHRNALYVGGPTEDKGQMRFFAVKRIVAASIVQQTFDMPKDFKLEDHLKGAFGIVAETPRQIEIKFDSEVAPYIEEVIWHESQSIKAQNDGSVILKMKVGVTEELIWWILSYGNHATVLEPQDLAVEVRKRLHKALGNYL